MKNKPTNRITLLPNYQPIGSRVIIKPILSENKTSSGISLTSDNSKFINGVVTAMSSKIENKEYSVGDTVQYNKLKTDEVKIDNETYHMADYEAVTAILK